MQLQNKQSPWKPEKQSWQLKKEKKKNKRGNIKQTKMIKNKPKTRIKANQHHKQLGLRQNKATNCDSVIY